MFAWISGSSEHHEHATQSAIEGDTILEAPETPAPVFAMRAFKQVLFGTPQPSTPVPALLRKELPPIKDVPPLGQQQQIQNPMNRLIGADGANMEQNQSQPSANQKQNDIVREKPLGILMTPGTVNGRRKQVKFGEQVVDNEGKNNKYSKSGLPDDFPGKFPSPWTPKTSSPVRTRIKSSRASAATAEVVTITEKKVESRFKEILHLEQPSRSDLEPLVRPPRSKDDGDVTTDLTLPLSASGRYWKDQYENYSANSVAETKRMIAKHKLAKDYARMKDDEAQGLRSQLDYERRKRGKREGSLERQVKDLRERLRDALADNAKLSTEVTSMRIQLENQQFLAVPKDLKAPSASLTSLKADSKKEIKKNLPIESKTASSPGDIWLDTDTDADGARPSRRRRGARTEHCLATRVRSPKPRLVANNEQPNNSPTPLRTGRLARQVPRLSPLSERSVNLPVSTSTPTKSKLAVDGMIISAVDLKRADDSKGRPISPNLTHGSIFQLDYSVPIEALSLQASQPVTPSVIRKVKVELGKTPPSRRVRNETLSLEKSRLEEARQRVAERRKTKRENRSQVND